MQCATVAMLAYGVDQSRFINRTLCLIQPFWRGCGQVHDSVHTWLYAGFGGGISEYVKSCIAPIFCIPTSAWLQSGRSSVCRTTVYRQASGHCVELVTRAWECTIVMKSARVHDRCPRLNALMLHECVDTLVLSCFHTATCGLSMSPHSVCSF